MPRRERDRQLQEVLTNIDYHQRRNADAARRHHKSRRRRLRDAGIDLRTVRRCPRWF
jgi:hypothetical protein